MSLQPPPFLSRSSLPEAQPARPATTRPGPAPRKRRALRAAGLMLAALLLHLIAANWGARGLDPEPEPAPSDVVQVELKAPPLALPPAAPKVLMRPPKKSAPTHHAAAAHPAAPVPAEPPPAPSATPAPDAGSQTAASDDNSPAGGSGDGAGTGNAAGTVATAAPVAIATDGAPGQPPRPPIDAPPSVELKYEVTGLREGNTVHGGGKIVWTSHAGRYRIVGSASILFFTLLDFSSEGGIGDTMLQPEIYTEKRFRKPATQTRFQQPRNTITFSESSNRYADVDNGQDRASIIWQLAATGRGDPAAFAAGAVFTYLVAGVRDAEPWRLQVVAQEPADGGDGNADAGAWHLVRLPRGGSTDQKIDIWLAPARNWYPVRIRYTETNGEYLDMTLSRATALPT